MLHPQSQTVESWNAAHEDVSPESFNHLTNQRLLLLYDHLPPTTDGLHFFLTFEILITCQLFPGISAHANANPNIISSLALFLHYSYFLLGVPFYLSSPEISVLIKDYDLEANAKRLLFLWSSGIFWRKHVHMRCLYLRTRCSEIQSEYASKNTELWSQLVWANLKITQELLSYGALNAHAQSSVRCYNTQKGTRFNRIWAQAMVKVLADLEKNDTDGSKGAKSEVGRREKACCQDRGRWGRRYFWFLVSEKVAGVKTGSSPRRKHKRFVERNEEGSIPGTVTWFNR